MRRVDLSMIALLELINTLDIRTGAANLAHSGTKEDDANMVCTSTPASGSAVAESNAIVLDNEGQEVRGTKLN